jgi:hypothetical protein
MLAPETEPTEAGSAARPSRRAQCWVVVVVVVVVVVIAASPDSDVERDSGRANRCTTSVTAGTASPCNAETNNDENLKAVSNSS